MVSITFRNAKNFVLGLVTLGALWLGLSISGLANEFATDMISNYVAGKVAPLEMIVQSETQSLKAAMAISAKAAGRAARLAVEKNLLEIAQRREAAMLSLMEIDPSAARQQAMSEEWRNQLPAEVRLHVEEPLYVTGTLEVLGRLDDDGRIGIERYVESGDTRLQIFMAGRPDDFDTGDYVTIDGLRLADRLAADSSGIKRQSTAHDSLGPRTDENLGVRYARALVININFNPARSEPWTMERVDEIFNGQILPWFIEASYNHFSLEADIAGWYTIAASPTTCASSTFRTQAVDAATADGFDVSQYDYVIIAFPRVTACRWAGLGQISGRYSWLNNAMSRSTATHELGHNLGLYHSHSLRCSEGPLSGSCTTTEYGDRFDRMGRGAAPFHGDYRAYLTWIPASDVISLTPEDGARTVTIRSVESLSGPRVLRVARPGTNQTFSIDMREPIGFSEPLQSYPALQNGVAVYIGSSQRNQSIIDMAYETPVVDDAPLMVGDTFTDPNSTLSITPLAVGNGEATITVRYGP
ncbi:MAG: hypothetical protein HYR55_17710 [Acidobacteria bacterium]|nr:hypothetical protein [Acidobacteriota bacterium]MBI3658032.1 hypothetical protein [Acidobacteriota bacterium]